MKPVLTSAQLAARKRLLQMFTTSRGHNLVDIDTFVVDMVCPHFMYQCLCHTGLISA